MMVVMGGVMAGQQQLSTSDEHDSFVTFKINIVKAKAKSKTQWESRVIIISNRISTCQRQGVTVQHSFAGCAADRAAHRTQNSASHGESYSKISISRYEHRR